MSWRRRERVELKTPEQIALMRRAGALIAEVHRQVREAIQPGVTTLQLDTLAETIIRDHGATPNFKGYQGFPATLCVSVNEEIVHGIPGDRVIHDGDVVSVDGGCVVEGWHSDSAFTAIAGQPRNDEDVRLVDVTERAMWAGIAAFASANRVGDIGAAVEDEVFSLVGEELCHLEDFGGHGIGTAMHQPPDVMNFRTRDRGPKVCAGMCLAIEPMLVDGPADYAVLEDDWTIVTTSGRRAAHWEHSVARTDDGILVLTAADGGVAGLEPFGVTPVSDPLTA
ncbi:type I methionyl aminopeptidase [Devriesea agamarum]|uniref:type I methionyl aminopeptidase n=1 Tax=Devriesea agamarum TaxID=472569 RepID=UPI000A04C43F|nr:type I methionyl aminopeptidase [Devriesea agamarum]